jgi:hypothetical protein
MTRRLAVRDRLGWMIAAVALGVVVYFVFPTWEVVGAVVLLVGVPVVLRRRRRVRR